MTEGYKRLEAILTATLTMCAVVITALVLRREFNPGRPVATAVVPRYRPGWQAFFALDKPLGVPTGRLKIVEFVDFQCPFCARFVNSLDSLMMLYPAEVSVSVRSFPLTMHPHALKAALVAQCAAQQGAFEQFYRRVFEQPDSIWSAAGGALAAAFEIPDTTQFGACMSNPEVAASVRSDSIAGTLLGIQGTPLVMVNGWVFDETPSVEDLVSVVRRQHWLH